MQAWQAVDEPGAKTFRERIESDPVVTSTLSAEKLAGAFDYKHQLRNVDAIFERTLAEG